MRPGGDPIRRRPAATLAVDAGRTTAAVNHPVEGDLNANVARNSTGGIFLRRGHGEQAERRLEAVDDHGEQAERRLEAVDDHGDPAALASPATRYDAVDRNGPNILIGEYGVANGTSGNRTGNLAGALAEAAFLAGTIRNADVVIGSAYAPPLTSVGNWPWSSNLIGFKMFSTR